MGFMGVHWTPMTMKFIIVVGNRGYSSLTKFECSLKTIIKTWEANDQGFLVEVQNVEIDETPWPEEDIEEKEGEEDLSMIKFLLKIRKYFILQKTYTTEESRGFVRSYHEGTKTH